MDFLRTKGKSSRQASIKVDPSTLPTFLTSSQVFKVKDQDRVVLPCEVTNPGPYVLAWKKGIAVLSAGSVKVSPDPRVQLINGFNLEIREVGPQDSGDYVCQIGTLEPREITHTLEVLGRFFLVSLGQSGNQPCNKSLIEIS
ncbi:hypothetical protein YQE_10805, partial [Dendroctonus ponderosae]